MTHSVTVYAEVGGVRVFSHTVIYEPEQAAEAEKAIVQALEAGERTPEIAALGDVIPVHCEIEKVSK